MHKEVNYEDREMSVGHTFSEEFAQWMLVAWPEASPDLMQKRSNAAEAAAVIMEGSLGLIADTARLLFGLSRVDQAAEKALRQCCVQEDPQFANSTNTLELALLGGAVLASLMRKEGRAASVATLAVLAGDACAARSDPNVRSFVELARYRRRELAVRWSTDQSWPVLGRELSELVISSATLDSEAVKGIAAYVRQLNEFGEYHFPRVREEADVAWWVLGEYSRDLNIPVREIDRRAAPLILGAELADITRTEIGPVASTAVLWRVLSLVKRIPKSLSLSEAIKHLPSQWLSQRSERVGRTTRVDGLTPVLFGIRCAVDATGADWGPTFARGTGFSAEHECSALSLAAQVYDECLLLRLLGSPSELRTEPV